MTVRTQIWNSFGLADASDEIAVYRELLVADLSKAIWFWKTSDQDGGNYHLRPDASPKAWISAFKIPVEGPGSSFAYVSRVGAFGKAGEEAKPGEHGGVFLQDLKASTVEELVLKLVAMGLAEERDSEEDEK